MRAAAILASAIAAVILVSACGSTASTPTRKTVAGIDSPVDVGGAQIRLVSAVNVPGGGGLTFDGDLVEVKGEVVSGSTDLLQLKPTVTTEDGTTVSLWNKPDGTPSWFFLVPKGTKRLTFHFPNGIDVPLDSILADLP